MVNKLGQLVAVAEQDGAAHLNWVRTPTRTRPREPVSDVELARHATRLAAVVSGVDTSDPDLCLRILDRAVTNLVGPEAPRRPGQVALARDIAATLRGNPDAAPGVPGGRLVANAPTGVGKSAAQLAPACAAALAGQRTVISTESLSLQAQILDKDGPAMLDACVQVTGVRPTIAVHKGWSNFVCTKSAVDAAYELTDQTPPDTTFKTKPGQDHRVSADPADPAAGGAAHRRDEDTGRIRRPQQRQAVPGDLGRGGGTRRLGSRRGDVVESWQDWRRRHQHLPSRAAQRWLGEGFGLFHRLLGAGVVPVR